SHVLSRTASPARRERRSAATRRKLPILSDVAQQAAVSLTTASRALDPDNDHPVTERTRARVLAAATRLAYRPNPMARALRTRRGPTIAIVVHEVTDPSFAETVRAPLAAASAGGSFPLAGGGAGQSRRRATRDRAHALAGPRQDRDDKRAVVAPD